MYFLTRYAFGLSTQVATIARKFAKQVFAKVPSRRGRIVVRKALAQTLADELGFRQAAGASSRRHRLVHAFVQSYCDGHLLLFAN
jgi:hypothetical protein